MRDGLEVLGGHAAADAKRVPDSGPVAPPIESEGAADDMARAASGATKAALARALPQLCAARNRLIQDRTRRGDTTGGDALVVGVVWTLGVGLALAIGALAGGLANSAGGAIAGLAAGVAGLALAAAGASQAVLQTQRLLEGQERARRTSVAALNLAIGRLDTRIARAYTDHGLTSPARVRPF